MMGKTTWDYVKIAFIETPAPFQNVKVEKSTAKNMNVDNLLNNKLWIGLSHNKSVTWNLINLDNWIIKIQSIKWF